MHPLLPYLGASGTLKISLSPTDTSSRDALASPFQVLSDCDPFSVLIHARLLTDAGSLLTQAFLLVQRDAYPGLGAVARPIPHDHTRYIIRLRRAAGMLCDGIHDLVAEPLDGERFGLEQRVAQAQFAEQLASRIEGLRHAIGKEHNLRGGLRQS